MLDQEKIDWKKIHSLSFVEVSDCWKTCDGYCCNHSHSDAGFNFMSGGSGMVFFKEEYQYLKDNQALQEGFEETAKELVFPINDEFSIELVQAKCSLKGLCSIPKYRPILCKIYPFFPIVDLKTSKITDYSMISLPDQIWVALDKPPICTLAREDSVKVQGQLAEGFKELLSFKYFLFYFKALEIFNNHVRSGVLELKSQLPDSDLKEFTRIWEMYFLKGDSFNPETLRSEINEAYLQVQ